MKSYHILFNLVQSCPCTFWILGDWPSAFRVRHRLAPRFSSNEDPAESKLNTRTETRQRYPNIEWEYYGIIWSHYIFWLLYIYIYMIMHCAVWHVYDVHIHTPMTWTLHLQAFRISTPERQKWSNKVHNSSRASRILSDNFWQAWPSSQAHQDALIWRICYSMGQMYQRTIPHYSLQRPAHLEFAHAWRVCGLQGCQTN